MDLRALKERYDAATHRVQTAIMYRFAIDEPWMPDGLNRVVKHLRVGIDMTKSDQGGLVTLLIAKGVFTQAEYIQAVTEAAEREADSHQELLQQTMGKDNPDLKVTTQ